MSISITRLGLYGGPRAVYGFSSATRTPGHRINVLGLCPRTNEFEGSSRTNVIKQTNRTVDIDA